jgi:hypothetical protein
VRHRLIVVLAFRTCSQLSQAIKPDKERQNKIIEAMAQIRDSARQPCPSAQGCGEPRPLPLGLRDRDLETDSSDAEKSYPCAIHFDECV